MKTKIIAVVGPTAVGKTALGIELAQAFNGEIISGDSQQVYEGLDIGTAKATQKEQTLARHHLIDVRKMHESYSAFDFVTEASLAITDISNRGKLPIIVGGTGLYLQSLIEGYHLGGKVNQEEVLAYRKELETYDDDLLAELLTQKNITIKEVNRRRMIRALELERFGQDLTNKEVNYEVLLIGLTDERIRLYERINERVDKMITAGLLEEASYLYQHHKDAQATRGIGYKEFFPYFAGEIGLNEAVDKLKQNTRRFAKRQLTWFRNRMETPFYQVSDADFKEKIFMRVKEFLEQ